jgi:2'-hydroxyisoflavone reductase
MRILIVGGTRFVGRYIAAAAIGRGHEVTLFHRGRTGPELFGEATHLLGDRDTDLSALDSGEWDATVDVCAYVPRQVHTLADKLAGRGGQYVYISSLSVYDMPQQPMFSEDAPLIELPDPTVEEVTDQTYGGLKVLCERAAAERFGDGLLIVRPTYVVGPFDYSGRFVWWLRRIARGGEVLAPGDPADPVQFIDVRDLAAWIVRMVEERRAGAFNAANEGVALGELLRGGDVVWVPDEFLAEHGVTEEELPLWSADPQYGALHEADVSAAVAAGLTFRPPEETMQAVLEEPAPTAGLTPEREAELIAGWEAHRSS